MKHVLKKTVLLLYILLVFLIFAKISYAQTCSNTDECNKLIEQYQEQITKLQGQASTLKNQIAQYDAQIKLTTLKIAQTQEQINMLGGRIVQLGDSLTSLTAAFNSRAVETYKLSKFENNFFFILSATDVGDAVSRFHYLQKIQEEDRNLLIRLQDAQTTYQGQKEDQEALQQQLQTQQANLNAQKLAKNNLLAATKNDEVKYQQLLSQAKAQLAAFSRFVAGQGGASILTNQTKCDSWGCYYNQRDSEWGNIGMGGSPYTMANYGCLVTSVAMLASHYGENIKPSDIAVSSDAFVPGTGYLYHTFVANGVSVSIDSITQNVISNLDSQLSAGKPVIAGLYSGPDHFIVILRKEGNKYIMNDPFLENGSEKTLTDKYNVSDITSLRVVSFN
jgi:peptidoglycan hydrolase CwlO-like protein